MLTLESRVWLDESILFSEIEGDGVLLNLDTGTYYGLDRVGARMFSLLVQHGQVALAYQELFEEYDTTEDRLRQDLLHFVDELASHGLLQILSTQA